VLGDDALAVARMLAVSWPVLPASGVPAGHFEPSLSTACFGRPTELPVRFNPVNCEANLPSVALVPDSAELFGWICSTPLPDEYRPRVPCCAVELAAKVCWFLPQRSNTSPATQWSLVVGCTVEAVVKWVFSYLL
jgi:hypothetical protein